AAAVVGWAAGHGLRPGAETSFTGHGQGRSPALTVEQIRAGYFSSALEFSPSQAQGVIEGLTALPGQNTPRPDPVYRLLSATGREYQAPPTGDPWFDVPRGTDVTKTQAFTETYGYDRAGNLLTLTHAGTGGFSRAFTVTPVSNRLQR
ncbi:hypothetical protein, partial [Pseudomonas sp. SID14000]|uniref:hypothetical protein n=1 Tax=Pseudomonas sp. SID14000 TaxID=1986221 RepID=UPI001C492017